MNTEIKNFPRGLKVEDLLYLIYLELKRANDLKESEEPSENGSDDVVDAGEPAVVPPVSQVDKDEHGVSSDNSGDSEPTE